MDKIEFFKLYSLPLDAFTYFLERERDFLVFKPKTMEEDLANGSVSALVYYFHDYLVHLYELANLGKSHIEYLCDFSPAYSVYFPQIFKRTHKKLDRIANRRLRMNHFKEIKVRIQ